MVHIVIAFILLVRCLVSVLTTSQRWPLQEPELASSERSLVVSNFQLTERNYGDYASVWW
jgi:hypothetical protein